MRAASRTSSGTTLSGTSPARMSSFTVEAVNGWTYSTPRLPFQRRSVKPSQRLLFGESGQFSRRNRVDEHRDIAKQRRQLTCTRLVGEFDDAERRFRSVEQPGRFHQPIRPPGHVLPSRDERRARSALSKKRLNDGRRAGHDPQPGRVHDVDVGCVYDCRGRDAPCSPVLQYVGKSHTGPCTQLFKRFKIRNDFDRVDCCVPAPLAARAAAPSTTRRRQ